MLWIDIYDIAEALEDKYSDYDIETIRFTDLKVMVMNLDGFTGEEARCNEKVLEAIQQAWIDERD